MRLGIGFGFLVAGTLMADSDRFIVPFICLVIGSLLVLSGRKEVE